MDPIAIAERLFALAARGDVEGYLELVHPDVEVHPLSRPQTFRGHAGIRAFFGRGQRPYVVEDLHLGAVGGAVVATGTLVLPGYLGGPIELRGAWVMHFEDGYLIKAQSFRRLDEALAAVGIGPDEIELRPARS